MQRLLQFLTAYRITLHATTGVSPTGLFLKWPVRTQLDLLKVNCQQCIEAFSTSNVQDRRELIQIVDFR